MTTSSESSWRRTSRHGRVLHTDNGYGYAVCGVGALRLKAEPPFDYCERCLAWARKRGPR